MSRPNGQHRAILFELEAGNIMIVGFRKRAGPEIRGQAGLQIECI